MALLAVLLGCAHSGGWRNRASDEREIRVAAYRRFLAPPQGHRGLPGLHVNCLGLQTESKPEVVSGQVVIDESPETLEEFRGDPEIVVPYSVCRRATPGRSAPTYRGEVIPWARFITIEWVDRPGPSSATIDLGVVECSLLERVICDGRGHRVRLSKQGDTWIVVGEQDTWVT